MKTNELMMILSEFEEILGFFPDMEFSRALSHVKTAVSEYQDRIHRAKPKPKAKPNPKPAETPPIEEDLQQLAKMSSSELLNHLQTAKRFKNKTGLQALANALGLSYTQKLRKDLLLNMIVNSFELRGMDAMIQSGRTQEEPIEVKELS